MPVALHEDQIGTFVAEVTSPPITRHTLALYCAGSADHNPIHVDLDFARRAGMPDVFAHGMLVMAYLSKLLIALAPVRKHRRFSSRFAAMTHLGDVITCTAKLVALESVEGERRATLELIARNQAGETRLSGEAIVAL